MARVRPSLHTPSGFLGIDAGGTRTTARWESADGQVTREAAFGPGNLQLLDDPALRRLFRSVADALPRPEAVAIGMAGARTGRDRERITAAAVIAWPGIPCLPTHDLAIALAGAPEVLTPGRRKHPKQELRTDVLVLSGTGSCCYGQAPDGRTLKVGGWGHHLGDQGSGYDIAIGALRAVIRAFDVTGELGCLGRSLLAALHLNEPDALIPWIAAAAKSDVASLAPVVFACAASPSRDAIALDIIDHAARALAGGAAACAGRLAGSTGGVRFVLAGSVLVQDAGFARRVSRYLRRERPGARIHTLTAPPAAGAVRLARGLIPGAATLRAGAVGTPPAPQRARWFIPETAELSPTEQRNPRSMNLDRLPVREAVELMLSEDERLPAAVRAEAPALCRLLGHLERAFRGGGRLFYVGAGTSGRLGILDASECPPTFRTPPDLVQGLIAGGQPAVFRAVEGAEDDADAGARAVEFRGIGAHDVVLGIAASGRTPFVWGALGAARRRGAVTALLSFNPHLRFPRGTRPDVVLAPRIGPEILTGSTRLKSGTATKLILNILTTLSMVRMGKVVENLMVDVNPANAKLRERAVRIVRQLLPVDDTGAREALERSGWRVKEALGFLGYRVRA